MSSDPFSSRTASSAGPGRDYRPVTPSDAAPLPQPAIALYVETGGAVAFISATGASRVVNAPDFGWILCGVRQVLATGTTAVGVHAVTLA
jgi:hypothetical protein